ncbi:MAG: response regulator [Myxococcota bacterium]|nr:response regulator [Myxococcota bacterium]
MPRHPEPAASSTATGPRSDRTPSSKSYTRRTPAADAAGRTVSPNAKTILVVEDAKDTLEFFVVTLSDAGYRVLSASSVRQALRLLRVERSVDAILADYNLGDGSGSALIHQARNEGLLDQSGTPALICTAYRYVELPPNVGIVHKPIGEADLLRKIACALEETRG